MNKWMILPIVLLVMGCEVELPDAATGQNTNSTEQASAEVSSSSGAATVTSSSDGFDWGAIQWGGEAFPGATTVDMTLSSARVSGNKIYFSFTMNDSWPTRDWANAIACAFMKQSDGSWYGGKFDWISTGGQSVKLTENIDEGYGAFAGHHPYSGQEMAFAWVSIDGKRRSNVAYTTWQ